MPFFMKDSFQELHLKAILSWHLEKIFATLSPVVSTISKGETIRLIGQDPCVGKSNEEP